MISVSTQKWLNMVSGEPEQLNTTVDAALSRSDLDALQVLDLTEAETAIVNALLEKGSQSVSKLGVSADFPRTTVYSALQRLRERGLVRRTSGGYASVWALVPPSDLKQELSSSLAYLDRDITRGELERTLGVKTTENKSFFAFSGVEAMLQVYQWLVINHFHETVCRVQPYTAAAAMFGKLQKEKVAQLSHALKDNKVALELIISEKAKALYKVALHKKTPLSDSLADDIQHACVVTDDLLPFHIELIIGKNMALLLDWKECNLTLIKHPETVQFLRSMTTLLQKSSGAEAQTIGSQRIIEGSK